MYRQQLTRTTALALAIGALYAPSAIARSDNPPPNVLAAGEVQQDLRSPDARDAATATTVSEPQDLRSPDARDAAKGPGPSTAPEVVVVKLPDVAPADGLDWADAAIGAGAVLGLTLLGLGGALVAVRRRRGHPVAHA